MKRSFPSKLIATLLAAAISPAAFAPAVRAQDVAPQSPAAGAAPVDGVRAAPEPAPQVVYVNPRMARMAQCRANGALTGTNAGCR